jgi:hypothetical protein
LRDFSQKKNLKLERGEIFKTKRGVKVGVWSHDFESKGVLPKRHFSSHENISNFSKKKKNFPALFR